MLVPYHITTGCHNPEDRDLELLTPCLAPTNNFS
jgi:hypothetical protein